MKTYLKYVTVAMVCLATGLWPLVSAFATLTATVGPGYQYSANERPTTATLNQLGQPTVTITGTLDGSTGLSAGSVTGTLLADSVPDGTSLIYNGSSPRQLQVNLPGLYNGSGGIVSTGSVLMLKFDPSFFRLATNSVSSTNNNTGSTVTNWLTLSVSNGVVPPSRLNAPTNTVVIGSTNGGGAAAFMYPYFSQLNDTNVDRGVTNAGLTFRPTQFTTPLIALSTLSGTNLSHGFSNTPALVRWVLQAQRDDLGYTTNDEVDISCCRDISGASIFAGGANRANVFISSKGGTIYIITKGGSPNSIVQTNWMAKGYARP